MEIYSMLHLTPCSNCGGLIMKKTAVASLFYNLKIKKQLIKYLYIFYTLKLISWANIVLKPFCLNCFPLLRSQLT